MKTVFLFLFIALSILLSFFLGMEYQKDIGENTENAVYFSIKKGNITITSLKPIPLYLNNSPILSWDSHPIE